MFQQLKIERRRAPGEGEVDCNAAHVVMSWTFGRPSPHEALFASEIRQILRKLLQRFRGNAAVEMKRRLPLFVQQRFRTED